MKAHLLIYIIFLLIGSRAAFTIPREGPMEALKAYLRGLCISTETDCDLSPMSSCWDETTASKALTLIYESSAFVANSSPKECYEALKTFFTEDPNKVFASIADAQRCEQNLAYSRMMYEKISTPELGCAGVMTNIMHYASIRPEDAFIALKQMASLAEQGNFEAVGLVNGNLMLQAAELKRKEDSDWRKNGKNGRRLLLKGLCESMALDCPMDSLNALNEEDSMTNLQLLYEWFKSIATQPMTSVGKNSQDFLLGRRNDLKHQISPAALERDESTMEVKLINEKIGFDAWSEEWVQVIIDFTKEFPESFYHYKISEYQLFENNNDLEAAGILMGLDWLHIAQWKRGKSSAIPMTRVERVEPHWRKDARNGRRLLLKGLCESLGLDCPMHSLNVLNEEDSATNMKLLHEWYKSVATEPIERGVQNGNEFLRERMKELRDQIPREALERDENSMELKLMKQKLGFDVWRDEWVKTVMDFTREFPEAAWHYKISEYQLMENNNLEGVGIVMGLEWYQVSEWKHGRLAKNTPTEMIDL